MNETVKTILAGQVRHYLGMIAASFVTYGLVAPDQKSAFVNVTSGIIMGLVALGWSWWKNRGQNQVADMLKKVTNRTTTASAVVAAQVVPPGSAVTPGLPVKAI